MTGIYTAAALTFIVAFAVYGYLIRRASPREDRIMLLVALLIALPLQPLVYYLIRVPLDRILSEALGQGGFLTALRLLYAPVIEEPAKWLPLAIPAVASRIAPRNAVAVALATGLGFGLGEIAFIAQSVAQMPSVAALPFYAFTPFFIERMLVCFIHGGLIALAFVMFAKRQTFILGGLIGMALHFALNFPIYLAQLDLAGIGFQRWSMLLTAWMLIMFVGLLVLVWQIGGAEFRERLARGR
jgi:RsiW-degrading membrane proteinase PrsW (M82 family)